MKKIIFAVLAGAGIIASGCVKTVDDSHTFTATWGRDTIHGRYDRTLDQVYSAAVYVVQHDGVLLTEYIPHDTTNAVRSIEGKVSDKKVWIRVESVDSKTTQVDVEARSKWGMSDIDLIHELEKEIAIGLATQP
jgi:hypothetical protein